MARSDAVAALVAAGVAPDDAPLVEPLTGC